MALLPMLTEIQRLQPLAKHHGIDINVTWCKMWAKQNINDLDIENLGLSEDEQNALVAFLKSLTDDRVRLEKEPFDHPHLFITNGHPGSTNSVSNDGTGRATLDMLEIPAVGRNGDSGTENFPAQAL